MERKFDYEKQVLGMGSSTIGRGFEYAKGSSFMRREIGFSKKVPL